MGTLQSHAHTHTHTPHTHTTHKGEVTSLHTVFSISIRDESHGCVQYLTDEVLHLSASGKFAKEESRRGDYLSVTGCSFRPQKIPFRLKGYSL
jgi:hypothetical protein